MEKKKRKKKIEYPLLINTLGGCLELINIQLSLYLIHVGYYDYNILSPDISL